MNKAILTGYIQGTPVTKLIGETFCAEFTLRVNYFDGTETIPEYFNCKMYGKKAETFSFHLTDKSPVEISGKLRAQKYQRKDGTNAYNHHIQVEEWSFCPINKGIDNNDYDDDQSQTSNPPVQQPNGNQQPIQNQEQVQRQQPTQGQQARPQGQQPTQKVPREDLDKKLERANARAQQDRRSQGQQSTQGQQARPQGQQPTQKVPREDLDKKLERANVRVQQDRRRDQQTARHNNNQSNPNNHQNYPREEIGFTDDLDDLW